jgi:hypothetical protein
LWSVWVEVGQAPSEFWDLTVSEVNLVISAASKRIRSEFERTRAASNELAHNIARAFHDPKSLPKYEPMLERRAEVSTAVNDETARGYLIHLALRSQQ